MIVCWSVKGGSGTTVVAATLALVLSARSPEGACVVDLAGALPATLGMAEPVGLGVSDWLMSPDEVDSDSLDNLLIPASSTLTLLQILQLASPFDSIYWRKRFPTWNGQLSLTPVVA